MQNELHKTRHILNKHKVCRRCETRGAGRGESSSCTNADRLDIDVYSAIYEPASTNKLGGVM